MFKKIFPAVILILISTAVFAKTKKVIETQDPVCKDDEKSSQTAVYTLEASPDNGIVLCSSTSLTKTKKNFSVYSFQKSNHDYNQTLLFASDDLMTYQIQASRVDLKIQENMIAKGKSDPLFKYTFSCIGLCALEAKDCSFGKRTDIGKTVQNIVKNEKKMQKLSHANEVGYEKNIRNVFLDALAGDSDSQEYFKGKRCGYNHYIDIDEECKTYEGVVVENIDHPCIAQK